MLRSDVVWNPDHNRLGSRLALTPVVQWMELIHVVENVSPSIDSLHLLQAGVVEETEAVSSDPCAARLSYVQCRRYCDSRICRVSTSLQHPQAYVRS